MTDPLRQLLSSPVGVRDLYSKELHNLKSQDRFRKPGCPENNTVLEILQG